MDEPLFLCIGVRLRVHLWLFEIKIMTNTWVSASLFKICHCLVLVLKWLTLLCLTRAFVAVKTCKGKLHLAGYKIHNAMNLIKKQILTSHTTKLRKRVVCVGLRRRVHFAWNWQRQQFDANLNPNNVTNAAQFLRWKLSRYQKATKNGRNSLYVIVFLKLNSHFIIRVRWSAGTSLWVSRLVNFSLKYDHVSPRLRTPSKSYVYIKSKCCILSSPTR